MPSSTIARTLAGEQVRVRRADVRAVRLGEGGQLRVADQPAQVVEVARVVGGGDVPQQVAVALAAAAG
jgi:hypothetical protein